MSKRPKTWAKFNKNWLGNGELTCEQCGKEEALFRARFGQTLCDRCFWKLLKELKGEY